MHTDTDDIVDSDTSADTTTQAKDELEAQVKDVNVQLHRQRVEYEQQIVAIQVLFCTLGMV
jgi:hypothetical protein